MSNTGLRVDAAIETATNLFKIAQQQIDRAAEIQINIDGVAAVVDVVTDARDAAVQARDVTQAAVDNAVEAANVSLAKAEAVSADRDAVATDRSDVLAAKADTLQAKAGAVQAVIDADSHAAVASAARAAAEIAKDTVLDASSLASQKATEAVFAATTAQEAATGLQQVTRFRSRNDAVAGAAIATSQILETLGFAIAGDGGGALYKRVSSEPAHTGKLQTADGAWWEVLAKSLSILAFGTPSTNDFAMFTAAATWSRLTGGTVVVPPIAGGYRWTSGILLLSGAEKFEGIGWPLITLTYNTVAVRLDGLDIAFRGLKFTTPHASTTYQFEMTTNARFCDVDLWVSVGNSGLVCFGSNNEIRFKGYEMRGSGFKFSGLTCQYNNARRIDLRNVCLGGGLYEDYANHNNMHHGSKYTDVSKYTPFMLTGIGSFQQEALNGYLGGDIAALTAGCNDNWFGLLESRGNRDGCCTLNGDRNHVVSVHFENTMAGGINITGGSNRVDGGRIVNVKTGIRFASSFGGISQRNVIGPVVIQDCKEYGVLAEGNSIRFWLPSQVYTDDPNYIAYDTGTVINLYKSTGSDPGRFSTGTNPPTHSTGDAYDAKPSEYNPPAVAVTFDLPNKAVNVANGHGLTANRVVYFQTTGTLPGPLVAGTRYFVKDILDANRFTVATTQGGAAITLTGTPTNCTITTPVGTIWTWVNSRTSAEGIAATNNRLFGTECRRNAAGDFFDTTATNGYEMFGCFDSSGPVVQSKPWTITPGPDPIVLKCKTTDATARTLTLDGNYVRYVCSTVTGSNTAITTLSAQSLAEIANEAMVSLTLPSGLLAGATLTVTDAAGLSVGPYPMRIADGTLTAQTAGLKRYLLRTGLGTDRDGWYLWASTLTPRNVPALDKNSTSCSFTGRVTAVERATNTRKIWSISGIMKRGVNISATTMTGVTKTVLSADTLAANWDVALGVDANNNPLHGNIKLDGIGEASKAIEWSARLVFE